MCKDDLRYKMTDSFLRDTKVDHPLWIVIGLNGPAAIGEAYLNNDPVLFIAQAPHMNTKRSFQCNLTTIITKVALMIAL